MRRDLPHCQPADTEFLARSPRLLGWVKRELGWTAPSNHPLAGSSFDVIGVLYSGYGMARAATLVLGSGPLVEFVTRLGSASEVIDRRSRLWSAHLCRTTFVRLVSPLSKYSLVRPSRGG